jgi:hypothetical protein
MAGRMDPLLVAECEGASPNLFWILDLHLASGVDKQWSEGSPASAVLGQYVDKVVKWGGMRFGGSDRSFSITPTECSPLVQDTDKEFSTFLEGPQAEDLIRTPATALIRLGSANPAIPTSKWYTYFTGIMDQWGFQEPYQAKLWLRTDTRKLDAEFGRLVGPGDFPRADAAARGQLCPMIWGVQDSGADKGAVKTMLVDTSNQWYLLSVGWLKAVSRVFVAGLQVTSNFTVIHPTVNGRVYTVIQWTGSAPPDGAITADVQGYETVGDGTGTLIENEANILKHLLVNFIYGDATSLWLADATAPVDTTAFASAAAILDRGGRRAGGSSTGRRCRRVWRC